MSKNKTYHTIYMSPSEDGHPVIYDWLNTKVRDAVTLVREKLVECGLRSDVITGEVMGGNLIKIRIRTNILGDQMLYSTVLGYLLALKKDVSQYIAYEFHSDNNDKRHNRFTITEDFGLMINSRKPIEVRAIGNIANALDDNIVDMWVAGEPNQTRKEVGRIRNIIRTENNHLRGLEWFIDKVRVYMSKDVALYIRTKDQPCGMVIHANAYDCARWEDPYHLETFKALQAGVLPDIFGLVDTHEYNFDFIAFMVTILDCVDNRRRVFVGKGGYEVVPNEFIQILLTEVMDAEQK